MRDYRNMGLVALGAVLVLGGAGFYIADATGDPESTTDGVQAGQMADAAVPDAGQPAVQDAGQAAVLDEGQAAVQAVAPNPDIPVMTVWKSPTCGCCSGWIDHLTAAGFRVEVNDVQDMASVKTTHGVPGHLGSCHTAVIGDYVVEGHVPAEDILRLLDEAPAVAGVAVPGMPVGSPGMEYGDQKDPYETLAFQKDGSTIVWAKH